MAVILTRSSHLNRLKALQADVEHRIGEIIACSLYDQLAVQRLKREKIQLQEKIGAIESTLTPDIVA